MARRVGVLIVDDHPIFSKGLAAMLEGSGGYRVVGEARDARSALDLLGKLAPEAAIVDIRLGQDDGLELIGEALRAAPGLRVAVVSMLSERLYAERALKAGARAYVAKEEAAETIIDAMGTLMAGGVWLSPREKERLIEAAYCGTSRGSPAGPAPLTDRQLRVLACMGRGMGTKAIAEALCVSPKTVEAHKAALKERLGFKDATELLAYAIEWTKGQGT